MSESVSADVLPPTDSSVPSVTVGDEPVRLTERRRKVCPPAVKFSVPSAPVPVMFISEFDEPVIVPLPLTVPPSESAFGTVVLPPIVNAPLVSVSVPGTESVDAAAAVAKVSVPPDLLTVRLLKVSVPPPVRVMVCAPVPSKVTVEVPPLNSVMGSALFRVKLPPTVRLWLFVAKVKFPVPPVLVTNKLPATVVAPASVFVSFAAPPVLVSVKFP